MNSDHSKICRLCLGEAEVMCPIFNSYSKSNPQTLALPQRIMSFAQIKLDENDGLPSSICYQCLAQVDKSYQFKLQCEQSDATLRQSLQDQAESGDEGGDWEMMKFTPEVIINEGEDNSDEAQENGQPGESDSDQSGKNGNYPLSEVQALLRHHGTEIRLQAVNGNKPAAASSPVEHNGNYESPMEENGNGGDGQMDYYPLYGVAAMLNNHANNSPAYSNGSMSMSLPNLLPRLPMSSASLSSLLHRKGQLRPDLSFMSQGANGLQKSRRSRDGQKLFQCRLCPKSYSFSSALSRHKAVHNTELRPHICNICKKKSRRSRDGQKLFQCRLCPKSYSFSSALSRHKAVHNTELRPHICNICKKEYHWSRDGQKLFQCRLCPKSYSFSSALSHHKAVHNTELRPHICNICKKCRLCPKSYSFSSALSRHKAVHNTELRPHICNICKKEYHWSWDRQKFLSVLLVSQVSFSSALSRHKAVHNTELRPHICNICKKGFADPEKLERHMRTHVSDQLFPCDICGRVFKALATFERHKLMTQGKCRQFSCGLCGLGFQNKTKLKLHPCKAAPHDRLYPCPQCSEVLNGRDAFEAHIISHTGMADRSLNAQAISLITTGDNDRRSI
ncbi:zinc finger protein 383-like [Macrosteles quadrilineatus]|uniref:zinc finger protein 383-like n=1 Tax=Macrosteles quadrilineatus TaxID=74068 RepID=UPI0023E091DB|nr:zinc finger protein 383-like [Macrosteles quadrilineatus]